MAFHVFSRRSFNGLILLLLLGMIPVGSCLTNSTPISPTSALPYSLLGNVTYQVEINLVLSNDGGTAFVVDIYAPQMLNWSTKVPDGDSTLQTSILLGNITSGYTVANFSQIDKYNNSIDYYQKNMPGHSTFTLSLNYTILTNQIRWDNLGTPQMTDYDNNSAFYKLYTQSQPTFIDITDPAIIQTAAMICGGDTNPVVKAQKIYNWVSTNISYQVQTGNGIDGTGEMGASWALANHLGDCSEYSDLMVAFLRAQGVPARKVVGLGLLDSSGQQLPSYSAGATWTYNQVGSTDNYTGHAWIEYYVPGNGWIACDPTWGHSGQNYFNYIDYLHVSSCRGEYWGNGVYPTFTQVGLTISEMGEYPFLPMVVYPNGATLGTSIVTRFTVINSNIWVDNTLLFLIIGIVVIFGIIGLIIWAVSRHRKNG